MRTDVTSIEAGDSGNGGIDGINVRTDIASTEDVDAGDRVSGGIDLRTDLTSTEAGDRGSAVVPRAGPKPRLPEPREAA